MPVRLVEPGGRTAFRSHPNRSMLTPPGPPALQALSALIATNRGLHTLDVGSCSDLPDRLPSQRVRVQAPGGAFPFCLRLAFHRNSVTAVPLLRLSPHTKSDGATLSTLPACCLFSPAHLNSCSFSPPPAAFPPSSPPPPADGPRALLARRTSAGCWPSSHRTARPASGLGWVRPTPPPTPRGSTSAGDSPRSKYGLPPPWP